jgi:hypothetical protein
MAILLQQPDEPPYCTISFACRKQQIGIQKNAHCLSCRFVQKNSWPGRPLLYGFFGNHLFINQIVGDLGILYRD